MRKRGSSIVNHAVDGLGPLVEKPRRPSVSAESRSVAVGGSVRHSTFVTGDQIVISQQHRRRPSGALVVYLRFQLHEREAMVGRDETSRYRLVPGKDYTVTISVSRWELPGSQVFVLDEHALYLSLSCRRWKGDLETYPVEGTVGWEDQERRLRLSREYLLEGNGDHRIPIGLRLPEQTPWLKTELLLDCIQISPSSTDSYFKSPHIDVLLDGAGVHHELAEELNFPPDIPVPDNWAVLSVKEHRSGHLVFDGWHHRLEPPAFPEIEKPDPTLGEFRRAIRKPSELLERIEDFQEGSSIDRILAWFEGVLMNTPEDTVLVIVEHTETHIPWELLDLAGRYLGSVCEVVRWTAVKYQFSLASELHCGSAVAYLDQASLEKTAAEKRSLERIRSSYLKDEHELLQFFKADLSEVGLVYMGCHGTFSYEKKTSRRYFIFKSLVNPSKHLPELRIARLPRRAYEELPLMLVNACHSGRLHRHRDRLHGFPKKALSRFARAYIGTMGAVADTYASEIGVRMLEALRDSPDGLSLSKFLRRLREEAAEAFEEQDTLEENQLRLVYTFMYVYYGNPLLRLRLEPRRASEETP